jgi:uncharacterized protein (TIGR02246 family)
MNITWKHHRSFAAILVFMAAVSLPQIAVAEERCCLNNFRFAGGCMVVVRGGETCSSVLSYLNNFDSVGKYYCDNTTVRGGWTLSDCGDPAQLTPQTMTPQNNQQFRSTQPKQPSGSAVQPQNAPAAKDANLLQVSAPLKVRFEDGFDSSTEGAGQMVTGVLEEDLMSGDTVVAPAGSTVHARLVPTSYWANGSGDAFQLQTTGISVDGELLPVSATATKAFGDLPTHGTRLQMPEGTMVSFETPAPEASTPTFAAGGSSWMDAFNGKDADRLAGLYADDAVMLPPNQPAIFGRDAIRADHEAQFASNDFKIELEALETVVDGHLAYVAGRYRMWTEDGTLVDRGKYVEIWRAIGGQWLIHRDIYNSSLPAQASEDQAE